MTHSINLLPWRDKKREQMRRFFFFKLIGSFCLSLLFILTFFMAADVKLDTQLARNARLKQELMSLDITLAQVEDQSHKKDILNQRLNLVNRLQKQRNNTTLLLNLLSELLPNEVVLEKVSTEGAAVTLKGRSQTNGKLAELLARLEQSDKADKVQIHSIIKKDQKKAQGGKEGFSHQFIVTFHLTQFVTPLPLIEKEKIRAS